MRVIHTTPYAIARRFRNLKELPGDRDHPLILAMLRLNHEWPEHDEVAWCKAAVNFVCHVAGVKYTKSLLAMSALLMGEPVEVEEAEVGSDIVILRRGSGDYGVAGDMVELERLVREEPGKVPPAHVGFFSGFLAGSVLVFGGNQSDAWNLAPFPRERILGVRRLY